MDTFMDDSQTLLITSEQKRIQLNQDLQNLMAHSNKSDRLKEIQLRSQMERLKTEREKSLERNRMVRRQMQEFEVSMSTVTAKTQALRTLKDEYEEYIEKIYPQWKEQVLRQAAQQRDKEQRLSAMTKDIRLSQELPLPGQNLHEHYEAGRLGTHDAHLSTHGTQATQYSTLPAASSSVDQHEVSMLPRSSTPEYLRATNGMPDRGIVSTSMQSINSEKSVTFDESSLKPPSGIVSGLQLKHVTPSQSKGSPRRHTPSPSELIRTSGEFGDTSSQDNDGLSYSSARQVPSHFMPESPPAEASIPEYLQSPLHAVPDVRGVHDYQSGVPLDARTPIAGTSQVLVENVTTDSVTFDSVDLPSGSPRKMSGPEVVIPSTGKDASDDGDSLVDSMERQDLNRQNPLAANQTVDSVPVPQHSMSSLNTTATEEPPTVDLAKTDEFKSMLGHLGGPISGQAGDESDSDDSMTRAILQQEYKKQLELKTNTLPIQSPITLPREELVEPSLEESPSEAEEELTSPMGYTPSFGLKTRGGTGSELVGDSTKYVDSLQTLSSTGDSKGSSKSHRAALRRTNSDVESESDFPVRKTGAENADEVPDEFFFG